MPEIKDIDQYISWQKYSAMKVYGVMGHASEQMIY